MEKFFRESYVHRKKLNFAGGGLEDDPQAVKTLMTFIEQGVNVNKPFECSYRHGSLAQYAIWLNDLDLLACCLKHGADTEQVNPKNGQTLIFETIREGIFGKKAFQLLLDAGANTQHHDHQERTPLAFMDHLSQNAGFGLLGIDSFKEMRVMLKQKELDGIADKDIDADITML